MINLKNLISEYGVNLNDLPNHGTSLEKLNSILAIEKIIRHSFHGEPNVIWFNTDKESVRNYGQCVISIIVDKKLFKYPNFEFVNLTDVHSYKDIELKNYKFNIESIKGVGLKELIKRFKKDPMFLNRLQSFCEEQPNVIDYILKKEAK